MYTIELPVKRLKKAVSHARTLFRSRTCDVVSFAVRGERVCLVASDGYCKTLQEMGDAKMPDREFFISGDALYKVVKTLRGDIVCVACSAVDMNFEGIVVPFVDADASMFQLNDASGVPLASYPTGVLAQGITRTVFACLPDSMRTALGGVLFDGPHLVATDGRCMAVFHTPVDMPDQGDRHDVLLAGYLKLLSSLGKHDKIDVWAGETTRTFRGWDWQLEIRRVEEKFPSYEKIVPPRGGMRHVVPMSADALIHAFEKCEAVLDDEIIAAKLDFRTATQDCVVSYKGAAFTTLPCSVQEDATVFLCVRLTLRALRQGFKGAKTLYVGVTDNNSPVLFESSELPGYQYVQMPVAKD